MFKQFVLKHFTILYLYRQSCEFLILYKLVTIVPCSIIALLFIQLAILYLISPILSGQIYQYFILRLNMTLYPTKIENGIISWSNFNSLPQLK